MPTATARSTTCGKGMPAWKESKQVVENLDHLYAYLKGRSDGAITRAKVELLK